MDSEFKLIKYYHTKFIKVLIDNNSAENIDVLYSFVANNYYNCDTGAAPLGGLNFLTFDNGMRVFECEECDDLIYIDNLKFPHNDVFYNISRIKLPSFELILQNDSVVDVKVFLSVYKNGFCGITYVYNNVNIVVEKDNINKMTQWGYVKYIKLPKEICDILSLKVVYPNGEHTLFDMFEFMESYLSIFDFMTSVVINIINNTQSNKSIATYSIRPSEYFTYFQLKTYTEKKESDALDLIKLFGGIRNNYIDPNLREDICDLSHSEEITYLLTQDFLLEIIYIENSKSKMINLFHNIDYLLNEKNKLYDALERIIKMENQKIPIDADNIRKFKENYLEALKSNFVYDFSLSGEYKLVMMIKKVLKNDIIMDELDRIFNNYQRKSYLIADEKEKEKESLQRKKALAIAEKEKKDNNIMQLLTLLFSIPAVSEVVDIFYSINVKDPIIFNIGIAKFLSIFLMLLIILCFFSRIFNYGKNKIE